jgi:hypothetical protein
MPTGFAQQVSCELAGDGGWRLESSFSIVFHVGLGKARRIEAWGRARVSWSCQEEAVELRVKVGILMQWTEVAC